MGLNKRVSWLAGWMDGMSPVGVAPLRDQREMSLREEWKGMSLLLDYRVVYLCEMQTSLTVRSELRNLNSPHHFHFLSDLTGRKGYLLDYFR
jgi:hypothetical protein